MNVKRILAALVLGLTLVSLMAACGKKKEAAAEAIPVPVDTSSYAATDSGEMAPASSEPSAEMASQELAPAPTAEPTPLPTEEASPMPTAMPTAKPVPQPVYDLPVSEAEEQLRPGTYTGSDGSVLIVNGNGTCTYEATVSGKINGKAMSAALVFHGTVEKGVFSFDKVMYGALDITALAAAAGYTDASPWETAAAIIYGG